MAVISKLVLALLLLSLVAAPISGAEIGVCYGNVGNNLPSPQDVVNLYKSNNIQKMRIYSPDSNILNALRGSNIELVVDVPNDQIERLASDPSEAANWVQTNIQAYSPDVNFKYIAVGNEVTAGNSAANSIATSMENIHNAISGAGLGDRVRVSTATFMALLQTSSPPSGGVFRDDSKSFMKPVIDFLKRTNSPLLVNVYPYFAYRDAGSDIQLDYALFRSSGVVVSDGSLGYQNLFDAMVDAVYSALEEQGGGDVEIVVSESGWPSEGNPAASSENAATYYQNLVNHIKSGTGTPKKNGKATETYLFAMFDENGKDGVETEKHFGLFNPNQQPKYSINFN